MDENAQLDGMRDWSAHAVRRKPWTRSMSIAAVKGYEALLVQKIHELLEHLEEKAKKREVVDISTWMSLFR